MFAICSIRNETKYASKKIYCYDQSSGSFTGRIALRWRETSSDHFLGLISFLRRNLTRW